MFFVVLAILGAGLAAVGFLVAWEWTYIQRLRHFRNELPTPPEWFEPKEIVKGASQARMIPTAAPGEVTLSTNRLAEALATAIKGNAASFLVLHRGKIVTEYYAPNHGPERWTDSASMMKTVTAMLIGIAIAEGKIKSADESAANYLAAWAKDGRQKITICNLLQMHSGLRPMGEYEDPFSDACYLALGTDARYVVEGVPLVEEPGKRYDYNNVNTQALGMILEQATGKRFSQYLSEKLWIPLGNVDAAVWLDHEGGMARTFGFLFATARDWARVGQLILDHGRVDGRQIVPEEWIRFMSTPSPTEPTYAAGLYTGVDDAEDAPFALTNIVALNGHGKQRVYVLPTQQIVIVRVGPRAKPWNDSYFPNLFVKEAAVLSSKN